MNLKNLALLSLIVYCKFGHCAIEVHKRTAKLEQMNWKDIVKDEDLIIKALEKLLGNADGTRIKYELQTERVPTIEADGKNTTVKNSTEKADNKTLLNILISGTVDDLRYATRRQIIQVLPLLDSIKVATSKKLVLWEIFKGTRSSEQLSVSDIQIMGNLLLDIPENDLYQLNLNDSQILHYLGKLKKLTRRKAGILAYAAKKWRRIKTLAVSDLNSLQGLTCGFSTYDLSQIEHSEMYLLGNETFQHLWACEEEQLKALLAVCRKFYKYAHVELWDVDVFRKMGNLILSLDPFELSLIAPDLLPLIPIEVFERFSMDQLKYLQADQLAALTHTQMSVYKKLIHKAS